MHTQDLYKSKYLKYKTKYLQLKDIQKLKQFKGGYGGTKSILKIQNFPEKNNTNESYIYINSDLHTKENSIFTIYNEMLDKLLTMDPISNVINFDFIDDFHSKIYIDVKNKYQITSNDSGLVFPESWKYEMDGKRLIQTNNSTTIFLKKRGDADGLGNKVLKIFTGKDAAKSTIIKNLDDIQDYLSLQIARIQDICPSTVSAAAVTDLQKNYSCISKQTFNERHNYNELTDDDFLKTNNVNYFDDPVTSNYVTNLESKLCNLYLSTANNNPINDFIINLLIQKILKDTQLAGKSVYNNFVKYDSIFVAQYNGVYTYFIIMDRLDGDVYSLLEKPNPILSDDTKVEIIHNMFNAVENICNILKEKPYLFTHTDLKLENIFYKLFNDKPLDEMNMSNIHQININGENKWIVYYIADFDKSSITYKNIRFYNNSGLIGTESSMYSAFQDISMYNVPIQNDKKQYKIERIVPTGLADIKNIETEQLYIRYTRFPYYTSFDYVSLILSIAVIAPKEILKRINPLNKFDKYITNSASLINTYNSLVWANPIKKYDGDFGTLLVSLITHSRELENNLFTHIIDKKSVPPPNVKKILITNREHKLCLSIPFIRIEHNNYVPDPTKYTITKIGSFFTSAVTGDSDYMYTLNIKETDKLYDSIPTYNIFKNIDRYGKSEKETDKELYKKILQQYEILFTGDSKTDSILRKQNIIVKTNKYSSALMFTRLYNYDNVDNSHIFSRIVLFYNLKVLNPETDISLDDFLVHKFVDVPILEKPVSLLELADALRPE